MHIAIFELATTIYPQIIILNISDVCFNLIDGNLKPEYASFNFNLIKFNWKKVGTNRRSKISS